MGCEYIKQKKVFTFSSECLSHKLREGDTTIYDRVPLKEPIILKFVILVR